MNLLYETNNYVVRYLQAFLQENYSTTVSISGIYDSVTHNSLLNYLRMPNVASVDIFQRDLKSEYPELFDYFVIYRNKDDITFVSKSNNDETKEYMNNIRYDLMDYSKKYGYLVSEFTNYNNSDVDKLRIVIKSSGRENVFPNKDMLCMINAFTNDYMYGMAIRDGVGQDDIIHTSDHYKVAVIPSEPNKEYTIAHGYTQVTPIVIASSQFYVDDLRKGDLRVDEVLQLDLGANNGVKYTTSSTCKNLLVQMPYAGSILDGGSTSIRVPVLLGDLNLNGVVDQTDRDILASGLDPETGSAIREFKGAQFVAANMDMIHVDEVTREQIIDNWDLAMLDDYLEGKISSLGVGYYDQIVTGDQGDLNKLLVVEGSYPDDIHIPVEDFSDSPWAVHDKFLNFLLKMAINPYSDTDDIATYQRLFKSLYNEYNYIPGYYDDELKKKIKDFQINRGIKFATGYMDVETKSEISKLLLGVGVSL